MKKRLILTVMFLLFTVSANASVMHVQVQKAQMRASPTFLGKIVGYLDYGDRVDVRQIKGGWSKIIVPGTNKGAWMHSSALTRKKIVLTAGRGSVPESASSDELALAGKGFNSQVEGEFKANNPHVDFKWVDRMESYVVSQKEISEFLKAGALFPEVEGQ